MTQSCTIQQYHDGTRILAWGAQREWQTNRQNSTKMVNVVAMLMLILMMGFCMKRSGHHCVCWTTAAFVPCSNGRNPAKFASSETNLFAILLFAAVGSH